MADPEPDPEPDPPPGPDRLAAYRAKRRAGRTPEPFDPGPARPRLFVVHKHRARQLHYDLRLELDGVLRSWAVPRGPAASPAEKRAAFQTEDHPLAYADFEGLIPEGNYGAGPSIVWDRGLWVDRADARRGLLSGKLLFELHGYKLRGVWTLVRTRRAANEWLLIKERDAWAHPGTEQGWSPHSVLSGLTVEELGEGPRRAEELAGWLAAQGAPWWASEGRAIELMLAETRDRPFSAPGWLFELKHDGHRTLARREGSGVRLVARRGGEVTAAYPEIARALAALPYRSLVLDGELVVLDADGRPRFQLLQRRALLTRPADVARAEVALPATYFAFDLLAAEGHDLRPLPLRLRKEALLRVLPPLGPIRYCDHVEAAGEAFWAALAGRGLEGMIAKRADSPYRGGRSPAWLKVKCDRSEVFLVVGFTAPEGTRQGFGALHLALPDGAGRLAYAGRVGTGFNEKSLSDLLARLLPDLLPDPPCAGPVPRGRAHRWVRPRLRVEVRYRERTDDGLLRHPVFVGLRPEADLEWTAAPEAGAAGPAVGPPPEVPAASVPAGRAIRNLGKVFWPDPGFTKGDLVAYFRAIAPWLLPYLRDRPLVVTRYPEGIGGKSFFQKEGVPAGSKGGGLRPVRIHSEAAGAEVEYLLCDDVEGLTELAALAAVVLHVWPSRTGSIPTPDWCVLDLDPKGAPFARVVAVARAAAELCAAVGLPSFVKTSGSTGLHVLVPLGRQLTHDQARGLAELLARVVAARLPETATVARPLAERGGRVYLDFGQNGHGKLLVAPFSPRAVPAGLASTPLAWDEVTPDLDPGRFTLATLPERMSRLGSDPLAPVLTAAPDLGRALRQLERIVADLG